MPKKYRVAVVNRWVMHDIVEIEANSEREAIERAEAWDGDYRGRDMEYDSCEAVVVAD